MSKTDYYRALARSTYNKGIAAWIADLKAGKAPDGHTWAPAEYLIHAISVALAEERIVGFQEGESAGRNIR